jgi:hypothetical protein
MGIEWSFRRLIASEVAEAGSMRNSCAAVQHSEPYYHPKAKLLQLRRKLR